jgi:hypothetical protein
MCDWEAEAYAEYLLWVDAEKSRAHVRSTAPHERSPVKRSISVDVPPVVAEA